MTLSAIAAACPPLGHIDAEPATNVYVHLVQRLATEGARLDVDALHFIANSEKPVNPVELKLVAGSETAQLAFDSAFEEALRLGVTWEFARTEVRRLADSLSGDKEDRNKVSHDTSGVIGVRPEVDDVVKQANAPHSVGSVSPKVTVGGDGALYVLMNGESVNGGATQSVIRHDASGTTAVALPAGSAQRGLLRDAKGNVAVASLTRKSLDYVDAKTGAVISRRISPALAKLAGWERYAPSGALAPTFHILEAKDGKRSVVIAWREDWIHHVESLPLDGKGSPAAAAWPDAGAQSADYHVYSPNNRKSLFLYGHDSARKQVVVHDLATGKELLRVAHDRPPEFALWMTEDAEGRPRVAWVDKAAVWRERDLVTGAERKIQLPEVPHEGAGYVAGRKGAPTFVSEILKPAYQRDFRIVRDGATTAETTNGVAVVTYKVPKAFVTPDGRHFAVGQPGRRAGHLPELHVVDLDSGEHTTLPIPGNDGVSLADVKTLPDGRTIAMLYVKAGDSPRAARLIQIFGPVKK